MLHRRQLTVQLGSTTLVMCSLWIFHLAREETWHWAHWDHWGVTSLLIGATAFSISHLLKQPWWWQLIHAGFAPCIWLALQSHIPPTYYLLAFILLLLTFRSAASEQVPLYFSNIQTAEHLSRIVPENAKFIDLGAGIGSLLIPLAQCRPDLHLSGIDNAPLPWLIGKFRSLAHPHIHWLWGNLWNHPLSSHTVAYCFLSPAPMEALWNKAKKEMPPGSLFISKDFAIPNTPIMTEAYLDETSDEVLLIYKIPEHDGVNP